MQDSDGDDGPVPLPGGHAVPPLFSQQYGSEKSRARRKAVASTLAVASALCIISALHIGANVAFDSAAGDVREVAERMVGQQSALTTELTALTATQQSVDGILAADTGRFLPQETRQSLTSDTEASTEVAENITDLLSVEPPKVGAKPITPWSLVNATMDLRSDEKDGAKVSRESEAAVAKAQTHTAELEKSVGQALSLAAEAAGQLESAHISARNLDVLALRASAADARAEADSPSDDADDVFATLESSANQLIASEQAELEEKAGALLPQRLEVEAYARSLAPGVLLDFNWAPIVNGTGLNGSMSGRATWWYNDGGYATIELSNSVAEQWPAERSLALVAHEVGHAISVRCEGMYDTSTPQNIEAWATAWAISMGHTDDANGVWAYGYPSDALIAQAAQCR